MPTRDTPWPDGTPCWIDYGAADQPAAKRFYGDLLGWTFTEENPDFGNYVQALLGDRQAAGMGPLQNPADSPAWTTYFASSDVDAHVARIREAGGTVVVERMEVGPMGTMAIAIDPVGNGFGLWQAGTHTGVQVFGEPGSVTWNEASVSDADTARRFYAAVFDFGYDDMPGAEGYTTFRLPGASPDQPVGGLGGPQPSMPTGWLPCFAVSSTDAAVEKTEGHGGRVLVAPVDTPFGRYAVLEDPWGAPFEVMGAGPSAGG